VQIDLTLSLPRDEVTVPVTRRILCCALDALGVRADITRDAALALTEACANVVEHAGPGDEYEVHVGIEDGACVIDVVDAGRGWDSAALAGLGVADATAEQGRGLHLIHALAENVRMENHPKKGAMMHFEKQLEWTPDSPVRHLVQLRRTDTP
jgi:serine/threonine-protein kinase RsbW